jgi:hypothetical protein
VCGTAKPILYPPRSTLRHCAVAYIESANKKILLRKKNMKKTIIMLLALLTITIPTFADGFLGGLKITRLSLYQNGVRVGFNPSPTCSGTNNTNWQGIVYYTNAHFKDFYALLLAAKNQDNSVDIWWAGDCNYGTGALVEITNIGYTY